MMKPTAELLRIKCVSMCKALRTASGRKNYYDVQFHIAILFNSFTASILPKWKLWSIKELSNLLEIIGKTLSKVDTK